jgi:hypothetical protein
MNSPTRRASDLGKHLFTYAAITDTHLNQGEDDCNSPFEVNRLANARMRHVVRDLNARDLAFVINLGDLVHPVPAVPSLFEEAAARFHEQVSDLKHKLYLVPGNHDVGDKPNDWAPAATVNEDHLILWEKHFGPDFHSFDHGDCHFVIVNAQIINSGFGAEGRQREWLEADLATNEGKRIFLNCHYPPYFTQPDEIENYDNIGEPGRSWLLGLMEQHAIEAMFMGHVHNFWYYRHGVTDCYLLPSTSFVRQDYAEMYRAPPGAGDEGGRNDRPKLGYFLVHMHENGHHCEIVRTYGECAAPETPKTAPPERVQPVHPRLNSRASLGFDMRQNWMEIVEIPPTGGLDEFDRKAVRNDYPLMAIWEMGVRHLRVPMRDLLVLDNVERMRVLRDHGHLFTLSSFGAPTEMEQALIIANQDVFAGWEIGFNWDTLNRITGAIATTAGQVSLPVVLSKLRSIDEMRDESGRYYHAINQGFFPSDAEQMQELLAHKDLAGRISGFVFRTTAEMHPWDAIADAAKCATDLGVDATLHLRMMGANPADACHDDSWVANRVAEALVAGMTNENTTVFVDTLADNDRGYFVRNGVLDRLWNPRLGFHVVRHLHGALNGGGSLKARTSGVFDHGRYASFEDSDHSHVLVLSDSMDAEFRLPESSIGHAGAEIRMTDLRSGIVSAVTCGKDTNGLLHVQAKLPDHPVLLTFS